MTKQLPTCPKAADLEIYLAGRLPEAEHQTLSSHIEACSDCRLKIESNESLESNEDPFVGALRRNVSDEFEEEPACRNAVDRIKDLKSDPGSTPNTDSDSSPLPTADIEQLGPYQPVELLGRGGMGEVYRAIHTKLKRPVAIKVLRRDVGTSRRTVARFEREMEAIGKLDHPHIVRASHADVQDGVHYLVMDYIEGLDFAQVIRQHGMLPVADACELVRQAADGLQHAKENGLVHRDIKPSNLMLCRVNDRGEQDATVKILDLGLALLHETDDSEGLTGENRVMGTPDYLAPEQWESTHHVDTRADIYSLGCTLIHLLAAQPPYAGPTHRTTVAKMRAHLEQPPPNIGVLRRDLPVELGKIINRCMAKSPSDRFDEPAALASALEPLCAGANLNKLLQPAQWQTMIETADVAADKTRHNTSRVPGFAKMLTTVRSVGSGRFLTTFVSVIILAAVVTASLVFWKPGSSGGSETLAPGPTSVSRFDAVHFRHDADRGVNDRIGLIRDQKGAVMLRDEIRVEVELNRPAWCYLLACNPDGQLQVCYPSDESPPEKLKEFTYPRAPTEYFSLSDGVGQQGFVLIVSDTEVPPWSQWIERAGDLTWASVRQEGVWVFESDKIQRVFRDGEAPRGEVVVRSSAAFGQLCSLLRSQPDVSAVTAIAFPVHEPL